MLEPKEFYRKLDSLLAKINTNKSGTDFLFTIVLELEATFGRDLHIGKGRIYEKNSEEYILISPLHQNDDIYIEQNLVMKSNTIQSILMSKTYIFDKPESGNSIKDPKKKGYSVPAAIVINSQDNNWIIIFELREGWIREEIEFCLNAVRSVLNFRLLSESIKNEYEQAYLIQKSLLPTLSPQISGYQIAGHSQQAELVGGDIFDYYKYNENEFGFCIGDASGHGIQAALMARDAVIGLRMGLENNTKMVYTLNKLNKVIHQSVYSTGFISLFYAEIESNGNLFYVNAGHPSPIIMNDDKIVELESTGIVFGALNEIDLKRSYQKLDPGSVLVLFTDGIIEREGISGKEFGKDRLEDVIINNKTQSAEVLLNEIFTAANDFGNKKKWKDDATVVVIKRIE